MLTSRHAAPVWTVLAGLLVLAGGLGLAAPDRPGIVRADLGRLPDADVARYSAVLPRAGERKWQQIPWLTDLAEGQRQARRERRPIFLWVSGDDPLGRC